MSATRPPWMTPGAPRVTKPSWLRLTPYAEPEPPPSPPVQLLPSIPPPRSMRPSVPPPSSRRKPPQIQTTRELELESEVALLHNELQRVTSEAESMRARVMEESEPAIVALAVAIAKRVVGREVDADPALLKAWIDEALGMLPDAEVALSADGRAAVVTSGDSTVEVGAEARMAAIADALGVTS